MAEELAKNQVVTQNEIGSIKLMSGEGDQSADDPSKNNSGSVVSEREHEAKQPQHIDVKQSNFSNMTTLLAENSNIGSSADAHRDNEVPSDSKDEARMTMEIVLPNNVKEGDKSVRTSSNILLNVAGQQQEIASNWHMSAAPSSCVVEEAPETKMFPSGGSPENCSSDVGHGSSRGTVNDDVTGSSVDVGSKQRDDHENVLQLLSIKEVSGDHQNSKQILEGHDDVIMSKQLAVSSPVEDSRMDVTLEDHKEHSSGSNVTPDDAGADIGLHKSAAETDRTVASNMSCHSPLNETPRELYPQDLGCSSPKVSYAEVIGGELSENSLKCEGQSEQIQGNMSKVTGGTVAKDNGGILAKDTGGIVANDTEGSMVDDIFGNLMVNIGGNIAEESCGSVAIDTGENVAKHTGENVAKNTGENVAKHTGGIVAKDTGGIVAEDTGGIVAEDNHENMFSENRGEITHVNKRELSCENGSKGDTSDKKSEITCKRQFENSDAGQQTDKYFISANPENVGENSLCHSVIKKASVHESRETLVGFVSALNPYSVGNDNVNNVMSADSNCEDNPNPTLESTSDCQEVSDSEDEAKRTIEIVFPNDCGVKEKLVVKEGDKLVTVSFNIPLEDCQSDPAQCSVPSASVAEQMLKTTTDVNVSSDCQINGVQKSIGATYNDLISEASDFSAVGKKGTCEYQVNMPLGSEQTVASVNKTSSSEVCTQDTYVDMAATCSDSPRHLTTLTRVNLFPSGSLKYLLSTPCHSTVIQPEDQVKYSVIPPSTPTESQTSTRITISRYGKTKLEKPVSRHSVDRRKRLVKKPHSGSQEKPSTTTQLSKYQASKIPRTPICGKRTPGETSSSVSLSPECRKKYSHILSMPPVVSLKKLHIDGVSIKVTSKRKRGRPRRKQHSARNVAVNIPAVCPQCKQTFKNQSALKVHVRRVHQLDKHRSWRRQRSRYVTASPCVKLEQLPLTLLSQNDPVPTHLKTSTEEKSSENPPSVQRGQKYSDILNKSLSVSLKRLPLDDGGQKVGQHQQSKSERDKPGNTGKVRSMRKRRCPNCRSLYARRELYEHLHQVHCRPESPCCSPGCDNSFPFQNNHDKASQNHDELAKSLAPSCEVQQLTDRERSFHLHHSNKAKHLHRECQNMSPESLESPKSVILMFRCMACPQAFSSKSSLIRHEKNFHKADGMKHGDADDMAVMSEKNTQLTRRSQNVENIPDEDIMVFLCSDCNRYFHELLEFREHQKITHSVVNKAGCASTGLKKCSICHYETETFAGMQQHVRLEHGHPRLHYKSRLQSAECELQEMGKNVVLPVSLMEDDKKDQPSIQRVPRNGIKRKHASMKQSAGDDVKRNEHIEQPVENK